MSFLCSFDDRVFIPHLTTRQLMMKYAKKSIDYGEMVQLLELLSTYCPCLSNLIHYLVNSNHSYSIDLKARIQCPSEYRELLSSLHPVHQSVVLLFLLKLILGFYKK